MKIERFNKVNENLENMDYYVIRRYTGGDYYEIAGKGDYDDNYDNNDPKDVVKYMLEEEDEDMSGDFRIFKITEEEVDNSEIEKLKEEIKLDNETKKYNL